MACRIVTLYAVWKVNTYKITYNANGGSGAPGVQSYTYAASGTITLSSVKPIRTGYSFLGWSTNKSATTATYGAGAAYNRNITANVTLYAIWKINTYTITYNANGGVVLGGACASENGSCSFSGTRTICYGANKGYYCKTVTNNIACNNSTFGDSVPGTVKACYPSSTTTSKTVTPGAAYGALPEAGKNNQKFNGWYTAANGGTQVTSSTIAYGNATIYAHWGTLPKPSSGGGGGGGGGGGCDYCCQCSCCCYGGCGGGGSSCFLAGTKVITPYGLRNIEDIRIGDLIYSKNMTTNEVEIDTVKVNYKRVSHENIYVIYDEIGYVKTTPDHPFYVKNYGWKKAEDLDTNDILIDLMGNDIQIKDIKIISNINGINVYNLQATQNHNYFVGIDSILVHNRRCFVKGTKILSTLNGTYKSIEDIKVGDKVVTYDAKNNKNVESIVTETYTHKDVNSIVKITFDDKSILEMTMYHPLYTKNGWKSITGYNDYDILNIGDEVKTIGGWKKILNINVSMLKENIDTYTIKVQDSDSYYANEILAEGMN